VRNPVLYINRDLEYDWLIAVEFGRVVDGQPEDHFRRVGEHFAYCLDGPDGDIVGLRGGRPDGVRRRDRARAVGRPALRRAAPRTA
jgi:hypothetical protein